MEGMHISVKWVGTPLPYIHTHHYHDITEVC